MKSWFPHFKALIQNFPKKGEGEKFLWFLNFSLEFIDVQQTQITLSCMCVAFLTSIDKEGQDIYELIEKKMRKIKIPRKKCIFLQF